jgi:poly(3-hydroxybutyrate) depolymerase
VYLSGKSAGGILVHAALCRSKVVADKVAVAIDVIGGIPDAMAKACTPKGRTNVLLVHGMKDEHLPWASSVVLDYVPFMSTQAAAGFWRDKYGLHRSTRKDYRGGEYK